VQGGHVETYVDPNGNVPYDYGVAAFFEYGSMKDFFASLNVTLKSAGIQPLQGYFADFDTGKNQSGFVPPDQALVFGSGGLYKFLDLATQYEPYLQPSYANFPPPAQIPADLLLTFSQFITKYNLTNMVPTVFTTTGMGMGDIDDALMIYVLQAFPAAALRAFVGQAGVFVPQSGRNSELYDKISALLGSDVLYSSTATTTIRTSTGVYVVVTSNDGSTLTIVNAKKLLVAFEPSPTNVLPLALDATESAVFNQLSFSSVHLGILNKTGFPDGFSFTNTPDGQVPSNYLVLPKTLPFVGRFEWMGGDNIRVIITGDWDYDDASAQALTMTVINKLYSTKMIQNNKYNIASWGNHGPMHARATLDSVRSGLIQKQYALQGYRSTYWTGAAFAAQFTTLLWEYNNQYLLPKLLASL
jgi:hypothetical protein